MAFLKSFEIAFVQSRHTHTHKVTPQHLMDNSVLRCNVGKAIGSHPHVDGFNQFQSHPFMVNLGDGLLLLYQH